MLAAARGVTARATPLLSIPNERVFLFSHKSPMNCANGF
jgi:hypothetical protein